MEVLPRRGLAHLYDFTDMQFMKDDEEIVGSDEMEEERRRAVRASYIKKGRGGCSFETEPQSLSRHLAFLSAHSHIQRFEIKGLDESELVQLVQCVEGTQLCADEVMIDGGDYHPGHTDIIMVNGASSLILVQVNLPQGFLNLAHVHKMKFLDVESPFSILSVQLLIQQWMQNEREIGNVRLKAEFSQEEFFLWLKTLDKSAIKVTDSKKGHLLRRKSDGTKVVIDFQDGHCSFEKE